MSHNARNAPSVTQVTLPGQSHTAEGPHDQIGMYVMHHAFRRDLRAVHAPPWPTPRCRSTTCGWRSSDAG